MARALDEVRILDFPQTMMGPWATQLLGDLGANVIKIKRVGNIIYVPPVLVIFFVAQRYFVQGIVTTGLKG